jgi:hypothetical protein
VIDDSTVTLKLIDGTSLQGNWTDRQIVLHQGLYDRTLALSAVRTARWSAPTTRIPAGTPIPLQVARSVSSAAASPFGSVPLCVASDVEIAGRVFVRRHAPATGQVLGSGGGINAAGGHTVAISAGKVLALDGSWIPLKGVLQARGGFNAAKGLLVGGDPAVVQPGLVLEAATEASQEISQAEGALDSEQQQMVEFCAEYFKFSGMEVVPVEQMKPAQAYAPRAQPLQASISIKALLAPLGSKTDRSVTVNHLRNLYVDGVSLPIVKVLVDSGRKGSGTLRVETSILVPPSHDRWVTLGFHVLRDGEAIKGTYLNRIDAEERKIKEVSAEIPLTPSEVSQLTASADPRLRITLTAIDN